MNICLFIQNISHKGGTERMAVSLANELYSRGYDVHVVSLELASASFFQLSHGIILHTLNLQASKLKWNYFKAVKRLRQVLKNEHVDVCIDVDVILSLVSLSAARPLKTKVIAWEHYNYFTKTESKARVLARKRAAKRAFAIVTLTNEDVGFYQQNCKCRAIIQAIPNFVEALPHTPSSLESSIVLSVGHLTHRKGFDMLLKAWSLVKQEDADGWKLHIVGDGEEKQPLAQQVANLGLESSVVFFPPTDTIADCYLQSSIYVMTSRAEGLPMVLIEAKGFGLPIVSFACRTGPAEIIRDGVDGYLVEPDNLVELKEKLLQLMKSKSLQHAMGEKGREDAKRFLSFQVMSMWEDLLKQAEK